MSLDLLCCESTTVSFAQKDPALLSDERVFQNMLKSEIRCLPSGNYLTNFQTEISPNQRKIVVDWMWEVSSNSIISACYSSGYGAWGVFGNRRHVVIIKRLTRKT